MGRLSRQGSVASGGGTPQPEPDALLTHPIDGGADRLWLRAVSRLERGDAHVADQRPLTMSFLAIVVGSHLTNDPLVRYQEVESRLAPIQEVESSLTPTREVDDRLDRIREVASSRVRTSIIGLTLPGRACHCAPVLSGF
jgi:hypothetical protein